jgi:hypothetical protein
VKRIIMMGFPAVIAAFFWAGCSVEGEQPSEEAAEEAGVEEIAEPSPEDEEHAREQAEEWVSRYEAGQIFPTQQEPPETLQLECQMQKAFVAGGQEHVDEIQESVFEPAPRHAQARQKGETPEEVPDLSEAFANAGYTCPPPPSR